jgi:hypothetical protein
LSLEERAFARISKDARTHFCGKAGCGLRESREAVTISTQIKAPLATAMTWTSTNLVIQILTGVLGAHFAAAAAREHGFGFLGHTLAGAIGGALSGYFLQKLAVTLVTGSGSLNEITAVDNAVMQGLAGVAAGGCLTLVVGFIKHSIDHRGA